MVFAGRAFERRGGFIVQYQWGNMAILAQKATSFSTPFMIIRTGVALS
jgi:hypothetical protein